MGTFDSSAFRDKVNPKDGDRDIMFNGPGDGSKHGHVVIDPQGKYKFVRDVEGKRYIDDRHQVPPDRQEQGPPVNPHT